MVDKYDEFLEILYYLAGESTLPFTEYNEFFLDKMGIPLYDILCIYSYLMENGYIKKSMQNRIFLTEKGLKEVKGKNFDTDISAYF